MLAARTRLLRSQLRMAARGGPHGGADRQRADEAMRSDAGDVGASLGGDTCFPDGDCGSMQLDSPGLAPPFIGDFYKPNEVVFRGVDLPNFSCGGFSDTAVLADGDFYASKLDVTRGLSIGIGAEGLSHGDCGYGDFPGKPATWCFEVPPSPLSHWQRSLRGELSGPMEAPRFDEVKNPPLPPSDDFFTFMVTTLFVSGISAARIGNLLLDFLVAGALARLEKVSPDKFSIKAELRVDECLSCMLKIRLYRKESELAVEFRRCSGDSVIFNACFQEAWNKLMRCGGASVRM